MQRRRSHRRVLVLGATLVALLVTPSIASADCGDTIVDEVFNSGSVEGAYALRCYDLAITKLEGDAAEYSEARGIISAAKIARRNQLAAQQDDGQAQPDPPRSDSAEPAGTGDGNGDGTGGGNAGPSEVSGAQAEEPGDEELTAEAEDASTDEAVTDDELSEEDVTTAAAPASFDDGDSGGGTPLPVLLLGGAAIVLIGVGAGGMVWRRINDGP
jgi:hypothetical protein